MTRGGCLTFARLPTMLPLRWTVLSIIVAGIVAFPALAQSTADSPTVVVTNFFDALHDGRWSEAAAMLDSGSMETLHTRELSMLAAGAMYRDTNRHKRRGSGGALTALGSDGRADPAIIARYGKSPISGFGSATTLAQVAALDPREFLARALAASARMFASRGEAKSAALTRTVVGAVIEGDSLAHVLYRSTGPDVRYTDPRDVEIVRLVRRDGRWWVDLTLRNNDIVSGGLLFMANEAVDLAPDQRSTTPTP